MTEKNYNFKLFWKIVKFSGKLKELWELQTGNLARKNLSTYWILTYFDVLITATQRLASIKAK